MCNHTMHKVNDVYVCVKCGFTITRDKKVMFDRKLPTFKPKNKKARKIK